MSFAAVGWCKQLISLIAVICVYGGKIAPTVAEKVSSDKVSLEYSFIQVNYPKEYSQPFSKISACKKSNIAYREIYSFETNSYHINICQFEDSFYYYRQSKRDFGNNILIPAESVFGGSIYKATSGKKIYFVGKNGNRYYSSVMLNNNEIIIEPELLSTSAYFTRDVFDSEIEFSFSDIELNNFDRATSSIAQTESLQDIEKSKSSLICARNSWVSNPSLDAWYSLLGKSTEVANKYAVNNGHNFVYDDIFPDRASIETKEGKVVNLNIAANNEVIEQICVQHTEDI